MPSSGFPPPAKIASILSSRDRPLEPEEIHAVWEWLGRDCFRWMLGVCQYVRRLKKEDAEEVVQRVLLRMPAILLKYEPDRAAFKAFLRTCLVNEVNEWWRTTVRRAETDLPPDIEIRAHEMNPETQRAVEEYLDTVEECLDTLSEKERLALTMAIESSGKEIAAKLGITPNHVRVIIYYARVRLKRCLNSKGALDPTKGQA